KILQVVETEGYLQATVRVARYATETTAQIEAGMQRVTGMFEQYVKLCQSLNYETMIAAVRMEDPAKLTDTIAANLQLSIGENQGHPEGTGTRRKERIRRTEEEGRSRGHAEGSTRQGHPGTEKAGSDAAHVGGVHRFSQLSRLAAGGAVEEAIERNPQHHACRENAERRSLRPRENQGAHPGISRRPPISEKSQRLDSVLRRTSGRGQNFARNVDRQSDRP